MNLRCVLFSASLMALSVLLLGSCSGKEGSGKETVVNVEKGVAPPVGVAEGVQSFDTMQPQETTLPTAEVTETQTDEIGEPADMAEE